MSASMKWFVSPKFDRPELKSPMPCIHGAGCVFTVKDDEGNVKPGCCRYVHPGEEGNGRRLFPETVLVKDGKKVHMPACVRLTGKAGFYERRRLGLSWEEWCLRNNIAYTPNKVGEARAPAPHAPVPVFKPVTRASATAIVNSLTENLSKQVASSALDDDGKAICNEEITGIVEAIENIFKRIAPSEEDARFDGLTTLMKAALANGPFRTITAAMNAAALADADASVSDEQYAKVVAFNNAQAAV